MLLFGIALDRFVLPHGSTGDRIDQGIRQPEPGGFVPLFNGKDLSGWKTHPKQPGDWQVRDGVLTCRGPVSHLFSDRADFENFHLKARVRVQGDNSGLFFRTEFGLSSGPRPVGYEVEIDGGLAGSLLAHTPEGQQNIRMVQNALKDQKDWFTMEVIAEGADIVIRINERTIVDCRLPAGYRKRGHLALQHASPRTLVEFSKIEVKVLPAQAPSTKPVAEKVGQVHRFEGAARLCGIAISPNGGYLLSTGTTIQLWDLHDREYVRSFPGQSDGALDRNRDYSLGSGQERHPGLPATQRLVDDCVFHAF
jgi:hypothetical protein